MFFNMLYYISANYNIIYYFIYKKYISFWVLNNNHKIFILINFIILFIDLYISLMANSIWYIIFKKYFTKKTFYNIALIYYDVFAAFHSYIVTKYGKIPNTMLMKQYNLFSIELTDIIDFILYKNFIKTKNNLLYNILKFNLFY